MQTEDELMAGVDDSLLFSIGVKSGGKCRYCNEPATKNVSWNDGDSVSQVCDDHVAMAKNRAKMQDGDRCQVSSIGEEKGLPKTETCSQDGCKEKATKRVLWAEGMAYQPSCDEHVEAVKKRIVAKNGEDWGEIVGVRDIKVAGVDTDPDPSPDPRAAVLLRHWVHGPGAQEIGWGKHGDFNRCVRKLRKHVGTRAEGLCNVYHRAALGAAPGQGRHKTIIERIGDMNIQLKAGENGGPGSSATGRRGGDAGEDARAAAAKKAPAKKAPAKKAPQGGSGDFNSKHPRNPDGTFAYKDDSGKGTAERGIKDKVTGKDGKVHGRISRMQANLVALGLLDPKDGRNGKAVDGYFGPKSEAALKAFQKKAGMKPTGKLDDATTKAINDAMLKKKKAPAKKAPVKKQVTKKPESGKKVYTKGFPLILGGLLVVDPDRQTSGVSVRTETKDALLSGHVGDEGGPAVGNIEYKSVGVSGVKALGGDDSGLVEAIISVTGIVDNVKDIIKPGAYAKSLVVRTPKGVWHHNWHESVSRTESIKELPPGDADLPDKLPDGRPWPSEAGALKVLTRFNLATQRGREAYADVKFFGDQQEWSIGYNVPVGGATVDTKTGIRTIETLDLFEYSPVLFGAMPVARTASVKSAQAVLTALLDSGVTREDLLLQTKDFLNALTGDEAVIEGKASVAQDEEDLDEEMEPGDDEDQGMDEGEMDDGEEEEEKSGPRKKKTYTKGMPLSAAHGDIVQKCIDALNELLGTMTGDRDAPSQDDTESKSLEELVSAVFDDDAILTSAKSFDEAVAGADMDAVEAAATEVLDAVEEAIDNGEDPDTYTELADYIASAVQELEDSESDESEPAEDEDTEDEEESADEEKVTVSVLELKEMFSGVV